jgi:peptide/nickel transport system substrate-binding protein
MSDGRPLQLVLNHMLEVTPETMELIKKDLEAVGIQTVIKPLDNQVWRQTVRECRHHVAISHSIVGIPGTPLSEAQYNFPIMQSHYVAPLWGLWYATDGEEGEEPPADAKRMMEIYEKLFMVADLEEKAALVRESTQITHVDNLWAIGLFNNPKRFDFWFVKNGWTNVAPDTAFFPAGNVYASQIYQK